MSNQIDASKTFIDVQGQLVLLFKIQMVVEFTQFALIILAFAILLALKGMVDAGLDIPHSQNILPSEERINGEHIGDEIQKAVAVSKKSMEGGK